MKRICVILLFVIACINTCNAYQYKGLGITAQEQAAINGTITTTHSQPYVGKGYKIGYSTVRCGQTTNTKYYNVNNYYKMNSYTPSYGNTPQYGSGPRKSKEKPDPDNNFWDWLRMNGIFGVGYDSDWPSYVDDDYWEWFLENYPEYQDEAEQWFEEHGQSFPWEPDDPYLTPINSKGMVLFLLIAGICYQSVRNKKYKKDQKNLVN